MKEITPQLTEALASHFSASVPKGEAYPVASYGELSGILAELAYLNRDYLLFYRGQARDFRNKGGASTLYPSLYRRNVISKQRLDHDFALMEELSALLVDETRKLDRRAADELRRKRHLRWALLQHYGVCETPLLDLTASLRAACTFAQRSAESSAEGGRCYLYAIALPYPTGGLSVDAAQEIVAARLGGCCPPIALRPAFQEGWLAGTTDITDNFDDKNELDFNRRLVAKFSLPSDASFWGDALGPVPEAVLLRSGERDPLGELCAALRGALLQAEGMLFDAAACPEGTDALAERLRARLGGK